MRRIELIRWGAVRRAGRDVAGPPAAQPCPGIHIRKGGKRAKAADLANSTWPNLTDHLKPHDYRHTHATWLEDAGLSKVIQMDRRGHAMPGWTRSTPTSLPRCVSGSVPYSKTSGKRAKRAPCDKPAIRGSAARPGPDRARMPL